MFLTFLHWFSDRILGLAGIFPRSDRVIFGWWWDEEPLKVAPKGEISLSPDPRFPLPELSPVALLHPGLDCTQQTQWIEGFCRSFSVLHDGKADTVYRLAVLIQQMGLNAKVRDNRIASYLAPTWAGGGGFNLN